MRRLLFGLGLAALLSSPLSAQEVYEGETLVSPMTTTTTHLIDMDGVSIMTWHGADRPTSLAYLMPDGSIMRPCRHPEGAFMGAAVGGRIQRIDADDTVVWDYLFSTDDYQQHHDIEPMPNGNVLVVAWERKTNVEAIAAGRQEISGEMWPTLIAEIEPVGATSGTVVWEWHAWDHLIQDADPIKPSYGVIADHPELIDVNYGSLPPTGGDWLHINAIDYDPVYDQITFCSRPFGEIFVIDHSTTSEEAAGNTGGSSGMGGDILYRWGNPQAYGRGSSGDQYFFAPHGATWIDSYMPGAGNILVFNNGDRPGPGSDYTTVDEIVPPRNPDGTFHIDAVSPFGPVSPSWTYGGPGTYGGPTQCGAYRLPNGNTLVCFTESGHLFEVTESGTTVWDYYEPGGARIARAPRYGGLANVQKSDDVAFTHRVCFLPTRGNLCGHAAALRFLTSEDGEAELAVFNTIGQRIRVLMQESVRAGENGVVWNGRDADGRLVPSGVYLACVNLAGTSASCRVLVLK